MTKKRPARSSSRTDSPSEEALEETRLSKTGLDETLLETVKRGFVDDLEAIIRSGGDVDMKDPQTGWPLLHMAVENRDQQMIRELVRLGASINGTDLSGASALHLAVDVETDAADQIGRLPEFDTINLLLALGADPELRDATGRTPRQWALEAGYNSFGHLLT